MNGFNGVFFLLHRQTNANCNCSFRISLAFFVSVKSFSTQWAEHLWIIKGNKSSNIKNALLLRFHMLSHSIKILIQMFLAAKTFWDVILECKAFKDWCLLHVWKTLEWQLFSQFGAWRKKEGHLFSWTCIFRESINPWHQLQGFVGNIYV